MAQLVDCHTHTFFSDGVSSFEENIRAAIAAGCKVLVSTDHLTLPASMDPNLECQVPFNRLQEHKDSFEEAQSLAFELCPELDFIYGFECDWYEGCEQNVKAWAKDAQVKLGSVHWIGHAGDVSIAAGYDGSDAIAQADSSRNKEVAGWIDYSEDMHVWEQLGSAGVWGKYVETWCKACESELNFDSMAHPDLPMRFYAEFPPPANIENLWGKMAECAKDTGRRIEISTASFRKGLNDFYPACSLLEKFFKAEVPITLGSDAHNAKFVCYNIEEAQKHAWEIGYRKFDVPRKDGSWESWDL
ncbi:MAG: PHP domain-containing protein, partial [Phoenicibacter congonensis]|nr:PHP domain-containing protein [Phoenicibacter congonensis]